jgi:hypothetical protein
MSRDDIGSAHAQASSLVLLVLSKQSSQLLALLRGWPELDKGTAQQGDLLGGPWSVKIGLRRGLPPSTNGVGVGPGGLLLLGGVHGDLAS